MPEKIRLIPDRHIRNVGRLNNGHLFFVDSQLKWSRDATTDFVCTFVFDEQGQLIRHLIEPMGVRDKASIDRVREAVKRHISALGETKTTDILGAAVWRQKSRHGVRPRSTAD